VESDHTIFQGNAEEEHKNMDLAIQKIRGSHVNINKLKLKIDEALAVAPKSSAHTQIQTKLGEYKKWVDAKETEYSSIILTRAIPNATVPTTSSELKKWIIEDRWIRFSFFGKFTFMSSQHFGILFISISKSYFIISN
jgi:hypothetical protein